MFDRLKNLYTSGKLDDEAIKKAKKLKWITKKQQDEILASKEKKEG